MNNFIVSIVVPVFNEEMCIKQFLAQFIGQSASYGCFTVVIVDNNSTDKTVEYILVFLSKHPEVNVVIIKEKRQGIAYATRTGFRKASHAGILIKLDADSRISKTFISDVIAYFRLNKTDAIIGTLQLPWAAFVKMNAGQRRILRTLLQKKMQLKSLLYEYFGPLLEGPFYAIRTESYRSIGGISLTPSILRYHDDVELGARLVLAGKTISKTSITVGISDRRLREDVQRYITGEYYWSDKTPEFLHMQNHAVKHFPQDIAEITHSMVMVFADVLLRCAAYSLLYSKIKHPHRKFLLDVGVIDIPVNTAQLSEENFYRMIHKQYLEKCIQFLNLHLHHK